MKKKIYFLLLIICVKVYSQEIYDQSLGTVYKTRIIENNVIIRKLPFINAEKVLTLGKGTEVLLIGTSAQISNLDNKEEYWFRILKSESNVRDQYKSGWVLSKYVKFENPINPTKITFGKYYSKDKYGYEKIKIYLSRKNYMDESSIVYVQKIGETKKYAFCYPNDYQNFYFTDTPGTYIWNSENNTIEHNSYWGDFSFVTFTNDMRYLILYDGGYESIGSFIVFDTTNSKQILSGNYYKTIKLNNYNINIIIIVRKNAIENGWVDKESLEYAKKYNESNKEPVVREGHENAILVEYVYNIKDAKRKYIKCEYIEIE